MFQVQRFDSCLTLNVELWTSAFALEALPRGQKRICELEGTRCLPTIVERNKEM
jgi:hypothetical protein